jgi:hypothetical protein
MPFRDRKLDPTSRRAFARAIQSLAELVPDQPAGPRPA